MRLVGDPDDSDFKHSRNFFSKTYSPQKIIKYKRVDTVCYTVSVGGREGLVQPESADYGTRMVVAIRIAADISNGRKFSSANI